jgi:hypothetical protein
MKVEHQVIVGNLGTVYQGTNGSLAGQTYREYVNLSNQAHGRCSGESVTWLRGGNIHMEFIGDMDREEICS